MKGHNNQKLWSGEEVEVCKNLEECVRILIEEIANLDPAFVIRPLCIEAGSEGIGLEWPGKGIHVDIKSGQKSFEIDVRAASWEGECECAKVFPYCSPEARQEGLQCLKKVLGRGSSTSGTMP